MPARLILGSASPRRRELLLAAGLEFEVARPEVDETVAAELGAEEAARELAIRKALAVAARAPADACVLAADTIVAVSADGRDFCLGKPEDEHEARRMLARLSGSRHRVVTGVCAVRVRDGRMAAGWERTFVTMRTLSAAEIDAYVASQEWRDKAGGYAIQENADRFVVRLEEGGFDNVVGLPVALALRLLAEVAGGPGA